MSEEMVVQSAVVADQKIGVVKKVEGFGAELDPKSFGNLEISEQ